MTDGFDPTRFEISKRIDKPKIDRNLASRYNLIGYVGHLYRWKGADCLVESMAYVVKSFPRAKLLIIGGSSDEPDIHRLKKLAEERGVSENVVFTGYVKPDKVPYYLGLSKILVIPTIDTVMGKYAMPIKIFEYTASVKAIVTADLDTHKQVLVHRKTALLVPPGDPKQLLSAINCPFKEQKIHKISRGKREEIFL